MAGAADVISAVRTPFVIGAPITVATRARRITSIPAACLKVR